MLPPCVCRILAAVVVVVVVVMRRVLTGVRRVT
jgi:hypothetical protein